MTAFLTASPLPSSAAHSLSPRPTLASRRPAPLCSASPTPSSSPSPSRPLSSSRSPASSNTSIPHLSRRAFLPLSLAAVLAPFLPSANATAATANASRESSNVFGYAFTPPATGWSKQVASLSSGRSATIFTRDGDDGETNLNFVVTPVPSDFQKLTSFGSMDNVLATIVPPSKPDTDIQGELLKADKDTKKNAYVVEYTVTSRGVKRHLLTVFSLQPGRYLLTLTGQSLDSNWSNVESTIRDVVNSYELTIVD